MRIAPVLFLTLALACGDSTAPRASSSASDTSITELAYRVVNTYPHSALAFTEGLEWDDSVLIEGTGGWNGNAWLRRVRLESNQIVQQRGVPIPSFGEGITRFGDQIFQLTWTEHICFVYNAASFDTLRTFRYRTEGWGLTHDGMRLIMSDGTSTLYFRDPGTFAQIGHVTVRDEKGPVQYLNELEYIDGRVYANVWHSDVIVIIDPATGRVRSRIDATGLAALAGIPTPHGDRVLNGIAWDPEGRRLFVTGKLWRRLFEIEPVPITAR